MFVYRRMNVYVCLNVSECGAVARIYREHNYGERYDMHDVSANTSQKKILRYLITSSAKMYSETSSKGKLAKHKCMLVSLFFITVLGDAT